MESLKPQDVLVVLKLCAAAASSSRKVARPPRPPMAVLGIELGLSSSEVHAAIRRARSSGLLHNAYSTIDTQHPKQKQGSREAAAATGIPIRSVRQERINVTGVVEFLVHGLKYIFPPHRGTMTRGMATSYAAPPLNRFIARGKEPIPVWPFAGGDERGVELEPLYRTVPFAASRDSALYELLVIADALREGRARERKIAEEQLRKRLKDIDG